MKVILSVILSLGCLSAVPALPATSTSRHISDDVEFVPPELHNPFGDQPIVDTGVVGFGGPYSNPFSGLFENLEGIITRMRKQMETLLKRFPGIHGGNSTDEFSEFPVGDGIPAFPPFGDIDLSKGNTTSITKVIDGHKVVINETEYKKEDDFGGAFFKVRIIDVKPDSSELATETDDEAVTSARPASKDTESIENSIENEIPKGREVGTQNTPEKLKAI